jgi:hypothetical protein
MFRFVFNCFYVKIDNGCRENIKCISSKCPQLCKCCKIYCLVIQGLNTYVAQHRDSRYGDLAVIKHCALGYQSPLSEVSRSPSMEFFRNFTYRTNIWYSRSTFGGDRSVMKDTLPEEQAHSWRYLGFRWRDFPNNSLLSLYVNLLKNFVVVCKESKIRSVTLKRCVNGLLYKLLKIKVSLKHINLLSICKLGTSFILKSQLQVIENHNTLGIWWDLSHVWEAKVVYNKNLWHKNSSTYSKVRDRRQ